MSKNFFVESLNEILEKAQDIGFNDTDNLELQRQIIMDMYTIYKDLHENSKETNVEDLEFIKKIMKK